MSKTQPKVSDEEAAFLEKEQAKEASSSAGTLPRMAQLAINLDFKDAEGNKVQPGTWHLRDTNLYSDTISFRPLRYTNKYIRMIKNGKIWKSDNESIFVNNFDTAYDAKGTIACGRIVGTLPESWTEAQKQENFKRATCYGMLFGLATFPNEEPVMVNFRAAPGKAKVIREAISPKTLGKDSRMYYYDYILLLEPEAGSIHPNFTMLPNLNDRHTSIGDVIPYIEQADSFIEAHNSRIMKLRERIAEGSKAVTTYNDVKSLSDDFNDEIPFGEQ